MAILSVTLKRNRQDRQTIYKNKINPDDFNEIAILLEDLKNLGKPIDKAIKKITFHKSDWDAALGL